MDEETLELKAKFSAIPNLWMMPVEIYVFPSFICEILTLET